jgi:GNAT superfamily N-acetyltransferase
MLKKCKKEIRGVGAIEIVEIIVPESSLYKSVARIYEDSFPENEKEKVQQIALRLKNRERIYPDKYHMLALKICEKSHVLGFGSFHFLSKINAAFLGYLAIEKENRNKGLGSILFEAIEDLLGVDTKENGGRFPIGIFTELEKENPQNPKTIERFRFWNKHNMKPLKLDWEYPPMFEGNKPANMYLAFRPFPHSSARLTVKQAKEACVAIYQSVYGRPATDSGLVRVISSIKDSNWVPRFTVKVKKNIKSKANNRILNQSKKV